MESTAKDLQHGYITAYRSFNTGFDDNGPVLKSLVAPHTYEGPVAKMESPPSRHEMMYNSGFYAVKDPEGSYPLQGRVWGRVDLFGEVVEGDNGYRAQGLIIRELRVPFRPEIADMFADRYNCPVHPRKKRDGIETRDGLPPIIDPDTFADGLAKASKYSFRKEAEERGHIFSQFSERFGKNTCKACGEEIRTVPVEPWPHTKVVGAQGECVGTAAFEAANKRGHLVGKDNVWSHRVNGFPRVECRYCQGLLVFSCNLETGEIQAEGLSGSCDVKAPVRKSEHVLTEDRHGMLSCRYCGRVARYVADIESRDVTVEGPGGVCPLKDAFVRNVEAYVEEITGAGHIPAATYVSPNTDGPWKTECQLCEREYRVTVSEGQPVRSREVSPCQFPIFRSSTSYLEYLSAKRESVDSWEKAHNVLSNKMQGDPDSYQLASNKRLIRKSRSGEHDAYAIRLHRTDIVTFEPDGRVVLRTGGWYTNTTSKHMREHLPQGVKLWSDGNCNGRIRWFVSTEQSRRRSGPSSYGKLVEGFEIGPRGGVKQQSGEEARRRRSGTRYGW